MRAWLAKYITKMTIRPIIYKTSSRFMAALAIALIWDRFFNRSGLGLSAAFTLLAFAFAAAAWLAHLRSNGLRLPRLPSYKPRKKDPAIFYGDMADHIDDEPVSFDELEKDEQDACLIVCDILCAVIFLIASLFV